MTMLVLRENDVIRRPRPVFACGVKNQSAPIGLKLDKGKLSTTPDTMAMLVLRENNVIRRSHPVFACGVKNQSAPIGLKFDMGKL